ncbi:MAG TPA: hypothetical protein VMD78_11940 [Candidatus Baltobacteraceae bacterium]|nr:hypothetical protein [Candidatus Baltobacteraceae bacterium]
MSENALPAAGASSNIGYTARISAVPCGVALWVVFAVSCGLLCARLADWATIGYTAATLGLFMLPGVLLTPIFYGGKPGTRTESAIVGAVFGLGLSGYAAIAVGFRYGWSPKAITLAILAISAVCAMAGRLFKGCVSLSARKWTASDHGILAAMCAVAVAFTAIPAMHVGKLTERGYAYTWLYGMDLLSRSDYSIAMTSKMPPDLFWMTGSPLQMYLVGYTMPAFAFAASGRAASIHATMLVMSLFLSLLLVGCLYIFLRALFDDVRVLARTAFVVLIGYGYYWVYDAAKAPFIRPGHRFDFHDSVSHLFQRSFLVEPQALLATSLLLIVLSMLALKRFQLNSYALGIFIGICLGISFGAEGMQGMLVAGWFGLFFVARLLFVKESRQDELGPFAAGLASCAGICASYLFLGMYEKSTSHMMSIELNTWILKYGLGYFPIEFGPLLILGVWGVVRWWRGPREDFGWPMLLLGGVALIPVLLIKTPVPQQTRMVDRLWPVVLAAFSAYLIRELWSERGARRARILAIAAVLAAVPTFFTDIYYTSNVGDLYNTRYVRVEDQQACDWIRQNLPATAVVQGDYNYVVGPDRGLYLSLISSFAQRPQMLGWFSGAATLVPDGWPEAKRRRTDVGVMMGAKDPATLTRILDKYGIDYVYAGPSEQAKYSGFLPLLQSAPAEFRQVYSRNGVSIFQYLRREASN